MAFLSHGAGISFPARILKLLNLLTTALFKRYQLGHNIDISHHNTDSHACHDVATEDQAIGSERSNGCACASMWGAAQCAWPGCSAHFT